MNKYVENVILKEGNGEKHLYVYLSKDAYNAPYKALSRLFDDNCEEVFGINLKELKYKIKRTFIFFAKGVDVIKKGAFDFGFHEYGIGKIEFIIPEGVKRIEDKAFYSSRFDEINLPESLEYIGDEAFFSYGLTKGEIFIPKNVTHIGQKIFDGKIVFDKENNNFFDDGVAIYNTFEKTLVYFHPDVKVETYFVKDGTENILVSGMFKKTYLIDEIIIPQSVKRIEECLWYKHEFKKVIVQSKETIIEKAAFKAGTKISYPDGEYFYLGHSSKYCKEDNDKKYYNYQNTKVTSARKSAIYKIEEEGKALNIYFSENINSDEGIVFSYLLQSDYDNVSDKIKKRYTEGYYHDIYVYLPDGIDTIKNRMFAKAFVNQKDNKKTNSKVHIIIGEGVKTIEESAFSSSGIYSVKLPQSLEVIERYAFWENSITQNIKIPKNVKKIGDGAFRLNEGTKVLVDKDNDSFYSDGYALYDVKEKELIYFFDHKTYKDYNEFDEAYNYNYKVLDGTKKIQCESFLGFNYYDEEDYSNCEGRFGVLEIPESIEEIDRYVFWNTQFKKVIINNPDVVIGNHAFLDGQKIEFPFDGYLIIKNYEDKKIDGEYKIIQEIPPEDLEKYNRVIYDYEIPKQEEKEIYKGEESELDIERIKSIIEDNKKEIEENLSKNPFDFDVDEIFKDVDYDYNSFDFESVSDDEENEEN